MILVKYNFSRYNISKNVVVTFLILIKLDLAIVKYYRIFKHTSACMHYKIKLQIQKFSSKRKNNILYAS